MSERAASFCSACAAGKTSSIDRSACENCGAGTYNTAPGLGICSDCSGNFFSLPGSTACTLCLKSFYYSLESTCLDCPIGVSCSGDGNSTTSTLTLLPGYWRIANTSVEMHECYPITDACTGGSDFSHGYCAQGYEGPMCQVCAPDYFFSPDSQSCVECGNGQEVGFSALIFGCILALLFIVFVAGIVTKKKNDNGSSEEIGAEKKKIILEDIARRAAKMISVPVSTEINFDTQNLCVSWTHNTRSESEDTATSQTEVTTAALHVRAVTSLSQFVTKKSVTEITVNQSNVLKSTKTIFKNTQVLVKSLVA